MSLPFFSGGAKKRDQMVAIDLGSRVTKAVELQRNGSGFKMTSFCCVDSVWGEKPPATEALTEHLKKVMEALGAKSKQVSLVIGVVDSSVRNADMPALHPNDLRQMLKFGGKNFLQQDLRDFAIDCQPLVPHLQAEKPAEAPKPHGKIRVLISLAKKQLVDDLQAAAKHAGLVADQVTTNFIGPPNAFEIAMPEIFAKEVIALVDIGYRNTTISFLQNGEFMFSRVVAIGAGRITTSLAETLGITNEEAEASKTTVTPEVESALPVVLSALGRELRASVDFYDHQKDKAVSQVFFSGGSARNSQIVMALQTELMVPCQSWNPTNNLTLSLPPQQLAEVESVAPQLAVAIGAALAAF